MASQMNFGPEWMRGGSGLVGGHGNEILATKDNSKEASFKYSKEYMMSLYNKSDKQPNLDIKHHDFSTVNQSQDPRSLINMDLLSFENNTTFADFNKRRESQEDIPLWSQDDKDNVGIFDNNGVFHLGSATHLPLGNAEFEQKNDILTTPFQGGEHRRAVSHPTSFFTTSHPPAPIPTSTSKPYSWVYRDPSGNVQGPFTAQEMQEWFEAGYFDSALNVKREDVPFFEPLSALIRKVKDAKTPFLAPWPSIQPDTSSMLPPLTSPLANDTSYIPFRTEPPAFDRFSSPNHDLLNKTTFQTPLHHPATMEIKNDKNTSNLNVNNDYMFNSNVSQTAFRNNPSFVSPIHRGNPLTGNNSIRAPVSPWERPKNSNSWTDVNLHPRQQSTEPLGSPGFVMNEFQQQQLAINQQMEQQYLHMLRQNQQHHLQIQQRILHQQQQQHQHHQQHQQQADMFINPRLSYDTNKTSPLQQPLMTKGWNSVPGTPTVTDSGHNPWGLLPEQQKPVAVLESRVLSESPPLAAFAKNNADLDTAVNDQLTKTMNHLSAITLEPSDRLTSKDIKADDAMHLAQPLSAQRKTPREIQTEEETHVANANTLRSNTWSSVSSRTQFDMTPSFSTNKNSSHMTKQQSNPWDKPIAPRQKHLSMTASIPGTNSLKTQQKAAISSSSRHSTIASEPKGPSEDFLKWCKLSLRNLNAGVNQEEILQMLLSFPVDNSCSEIIQDIIYANSTCMDGRRFASDFITRRKADMDGKKLNVILPKASVIATPEFKVVTKKHKKKYQQ